MEYIKLQNLQNRYPSILNYKSKVKDFITLEGKYPLDNKIDFKISPINEIKLDDIQSIDGTSFRFVLAIKEKSNDRNSVYYTSPPFLKDLQSALNEPNPYFITDALKKEFIVEYVLENVLNLVKGFRKDETDNFAVNVNKHFFITSDDKIDYKTLVKYIDFVVSSPKPQEITNKGVIPAKELLPKQNFKIDELKLKDLIKVNFDANKFQLPFTPITFNAAESPSGATPGAGSGGGGGNTIGGGYVGNQDSMNNGYANTGRAGDASYSGNADYVYNPSGYAGR